MAAVSSPIYIVHEVSDFLLFAPKPLRDLLPRLTPALEQLLDGHGAAGLRAAHGGEDDRQRLEIITAAALRLSPLLERVDELRKTGIRPRERHLQRRDLLLHGGLAGAVRGKLDPILIPGEAAVWP